MASVPPWSDLRAPLQVLAGAGDGLEGKRCIVTGAHMQPACTSALRARIACAVLGGWASREQRWDLQAFLLVCLGAPTPSSPAGAGNVAQYCAEKLIEEGATVLAMSDSK